MRAWFILMSLTIVAVSFLFLNPAHQVGNEIILQWLSFFLVGGTGLVMAIFFIFYSKSDFDKIKNFISRLTVGIFGASFFILLATGYLKGWFRETNYQPDFFSAGMCMPFAISIMAWALQKEEE